MDRELLEEYKMELADRYTAAELVELMEENEFIDVWAILEAFEEEVIKLKFR